MAMTGYPQGMENYDEMEEVDPDSADIEKVIELYYGTEKDKIEAGKQTLLFCLYPENMRIMLDHESLFGVTSRTLRDEFKKSYELTLYLLGAFYAFSNYIQFHPFLIQNQIGDTTIKIIEYHIRRGLIQNIEINKKTENFRQSTSKPPEAKKELEMERKKFEIMIKKQDKILCLCFQVLLNLADDVQIERKMRKRKVVSYLLGMLDRNNIFLILVSITFLKKMAIFSENVKEMKEEGIIKRLRRFILISHQGIKQCSLRLLYNLSFNGECRDEMEKTGLIPILVELLKIPPLRGMMLKMLYQVSQDEKAKGTFTYTEAIPLLYELLIRFPEGPVGIELVALVVNLSSKERNAQLLAKGNQYEKMVKRAIRHSDALLFKVVRNIAQFANDMVIDVLEKYVVDFIKLAKQTENSDIQVEILGTLVYTHIEGWDEILKNTQFLDFLQNHLVVGYAEDDVILECIMLLGTVCANEKSGTLIAKSHSIKILTELINTKTEDDEMVLQIMHTFHKMFFFKETREIILYKTEIVSYLLDLMGDKNETIREEVNNMTEIVQYYDESLKQAITKKRYEVHNQIYIELMDQQEAHLAMQEENAIQGYPGMAPGNMNMFLNEQLNSPMMLYDQSDLATHVWDDERGAQI